MTKFSRQFVPDLASISLSKYQPMSSVAFSADRPFTLIDTPFQLTVEIVDEWLGDIIVELCEDIDDGVEGVIACRRHPFDFLRKTREMLGRNARGRQRAHLDLCVGQFHVVEDTKDDIEEFDPPTLIERFTVVFHDFKHHCQGSRDRTFVLHPLGETFDSTCLVLTSSLQRLIIQDNSNRTGNHPLTHTRSSSDTLTKSSAACSRNT